MKATVKNTFTSFEAAQPGHASGIVVSNVWASYGDRQVLAGIDLTVEPGSIVAVTGPNGVGKSTLLKLIAGMLSPARGSVTVGQVDVSAVPARVRARLVAVVPQEPQLPSGTTSVEVVMMGRNPHLGLFSWEGEDDLEIAVSAMAATDTLDLIDRPVNRLSGGERQRVTIAMALAQQTPVMLLDEPTANLDLAYQPRIMDLLRQLAHSGKTVLAAIHDLTLAAEFCDMVAIMAEGRILSVGAPEQVLTPENIRRAYGADVRVISHPDTGKPIVVNAWRPEQQGTAVG